MHKQSNLTLNKSHYSHFLVGIFIFFFAFFSSALISGALTPADDSSASTLSVENRATGYFITVTSPSTTTIDINPTPSGSTAISSASNVNVTTNAPLGYKLYLSAEDNELKPTNSTILQNNSNAKFTPTTTTTLSTNSWGYSLNGTAFYAVPEVINSSVMEESELITAGATDITPSGADTSNYPNGTNIPIYYGINSNTNMPAATYTTTVTYTAFGEGIDMKNYNIGEEVAYNVTTGESCTNPTSSVGLKSGCMKFFVIKDNEYTIDAMLDHNTSTYKKWASSVNTYGPETSGSDYALPSLKSDTDNWTGVVQPDNYTFTFNNGSQNITYTINYNGYKARLITAEEIAGILGFNVDFAIQAPQNIYPNNKSTFWWLNDWLSKCSEGMGCHNDPNPTDGSAGGTDRYHGNAGYWTATAAATKTNRAWTYIRDNHLCWGYGSGWVNGFVNTNDMYGIRPVVRIYKMKLE